MSLANMSIIEKDDLIKKMPKDALKRELREPSGNLPLFLIAARLKEVESMEQEAMANQFAQEAQGDEPTIAHRLAREIMPQAPLSGMAAMPSPQPRPDPQGQMAQALAGPRREMPTVYRSFGGLAALGGAANPATYEALMQNPEILGLGPFLASRFLGGDDDTPDPEPAPVPQETRVLPPTVQVQPSQVPGSNAPVQIAGGDTLPTVRAQSGLKGKYPGDAARVTAEMLAAAARRRKESGKPRLYNQGRQISFEKTIKEGASPAAQMAAMFGIPSAIARQEERVFGGMDTLPPYQPESNPMALRSKGFTSPTRTLAHRGADEGASGLDYLKMMKDIAGDSDDLPTVFAQDGYQIYPDTMQGYMDQYGLTPHDALKLRQKGLGIQQAAERKSSQFTEQDPDILGQDPLEAQAVQLLNPPPPVTQRAGPSVSPIATTTDTAADLSEFPAVDLSGDPMFGYDSRAGSQSIASQEAPPPVAPPPVALSQASGPALEQSPLNINKMRERLGLSGKTEPVKVGAVDSIKEFQKTYGALLPDQSKAREKITKDYEKALQEEKARDVVPQGLKDIRSEYENRIEALDKSGLPFMTAAAAVLKGNQPTLVALTNAMIGYTAGDEQLKKQGLSLIKDMSKLDIEVATLEAAQREQVNKARAAVMKAREAELTGNEARAAAVLDVASKARTSAQNLAIKKAELTNASENRKNQIFATIAPTIIKNERDERMLREATQAFRKRGLSEGEAKIKALTLLEGKGTNPLAALAAQRAAQDQAFQITGLADKYFADYFKNAGTGSYLKLAKTEGAPENVSKEELIKWGLRSGNISLPDDMNPQLKNIILQRAGVGSQSQAGKQSKGSANWNEMK